ncbi:MAG: cobyrinate a,c-diamide synthase [Oscillospiraceae bacterium]
MTETLKRFMITGTGSGCGKTTITCAVLKALVNRKLKVASFKAGPDYIDPMFHSKIIGTSSRNLDIYMCGERNVKYLFANAAKNADISVIEGVMGNYDGLGINSDDYSSNHLARLTNTPQILVVGTKGMGFSVVAMISGFLNFRPNNIKGVILNNTSQASYEMLKPMIEKELPIKVYGYMPQVQEAEIGSRHLGLITADEIFDLNQRLEILAETAEKTIDIDGLLGLAQTYEKYMCADVLLDYNLPQKPTRIAVAKDNAFCFYYEDNLNLFKIMGGEIVEFSPMNDEKLPENIDALILGGGYPEVYAKQISENKSMLSDIKEKLQKGLPLIAECGGFMYLHNSLTDCDGEKHKMVGFIDSDCYMTKKSVRFGYAKLKAQYDNVLCKKGEEISAHEFHYSDSSNCGDAFLATKNSGKNWEAAFANDAIYAGYPHLHFWGNIDFAINFYNKILVKKAGDYKNER